MKNITSSISWQKLWEYINPPLKSFSKICRSKLTLNSRACYSRIKIKSTQHEWCEKLGRNLDWSVLMGNNVCMYMCASSLLLTRWNQPQNPSQPAGQPCRMLIKNLIILNQILPSYLQSSVFQHDHSHSLSVLYWSVLLLHYLKCFWLRFLQLKTFWEILKWQFHFNSTRCCFFPSN